MITSYEICAFRQQDIAWANIDPDHMASLGHNELTHWPLENLNEILDM